MAKRFTDTDKWRKPHVRGMQGAYKLLWLYILDECDHCGLWHVDMEVAKIRIGESVNVDDAIKSFGDQIIILDDGQTWFIPEFIDFQYGGFADMNEKNKVHASVYKNLRRYETQIKGHTSPIQGAKDKDKDKDILELELTRAEIENVRVSAKAHFGFMISDQVISDQHASFCRSYMNESYPNRKEQQKHFMNWLKKQKISQQQNPNSFFI